MILFQLYFEVAPEKTAEFETTYREVFLPALSSQQGFKHAKLIRSYSPAIAAEIGARADEYNYQVNFVFESEELKQKVFAEIAGVVEPDVPEGVEVAGVRDRGERRLEAGQLFLGNRVRVLVLGEAPFPHVRREALAVGLGCASPRAPESAEERTVPVVPGRPSPAACAEELYRTTIVASDHGRTGTARERELVRRYPREPRERVAHLRLLCSRLGVVGEVLEAAAAAGAEVTAGCLHAIAARLEQGRADRLREAALHLRRASLDEVAGQPAADEDDEAVDPSHAVAAVGERVDAHVELVPCADGGCHAPRVAGARGSVCRPCRPTSDALRSGRRVSLALRSPTPRGRMAADLGAFSHRQAGAVTRRTLITSTTNDRLKAVRRLARRRDPG